MPIPTSPGRELPPSSYLPEVPRISAEEVKTKLDGGINLVIIDSRSKSSYDQSHIKGAISIPMSTMAEPYSDLDSYDEIITYCG
jgi:rhodanese-related sulfurtransferase